VWGGGWRSEYTSGTGPLPRVEVLNQLDSPICFLLALTDLGNTINCFTYYAAVSTLHMGIASSSTDQL
jgi:hypothetical protein